MARTVGSRVGGSLASRTVAVSAMLAAVIGGAYFLLALVIADLRETNSRVDGQVAKAAGDLKPGASQSR